MHWLARVACVAYFCFHSGYGQVVHESVADSSAKHAVLVDAGSTSTKTYLISEYDNDLNVSLLGKGSPLSSYIGRPGKAKLCMMKELQEAEQRIPRPEHAAVAVMILATAGMRGLKEASVKRLFRALHRGLQSGGAFPFSSASLQIRIISGWEEAAWALIAANYLTSRVDVSLVVGDGGLVGVLEVGGASAQIAVPPAEAVHGSLLLQHLVPPSSMYAQSFSAFGFDTMRLRIYSRFKSRKKRLRWKAEPAANPCAAPGLEGREPKGSHWQGAGSAPECELLLRKELASERTACQFQEGLQSAKSTQTSATNAGCLPAGRVKNFVAPTSNDQPAFFLISGYLYVLDFTRHVLQQLNWTSSHNGHIHPEDDDFFLRPKLNDLREAARKLCALPWESLLAIANAQPVHRYTPSKKVPNRCFELNYVIALLTEGFGFAPDEVGLFQAVPNIKGIEIGWPLGAYLYYRNLAASGLSGSPPTEEL